MTSFTKIFLHPKAVSAGKVETAYVHQLASLKRVWHDETYGIERLVRLLLCAIQFIYPILLIREISGKRGATTRKLAIEFYTLLKFLFPLVVLVYGLYRYHAIIFVIIYLLSETILHILNLVFLSDIYAISISYHRSVLLLCLHYIEVVFDYAVIYIGFGLLSERVSWISAIYFSLVANATVGFGDIVPQGSRGQLVLITQLLIGVLFVILFFNYFSQKINGKKA